MIISDIGWTINTFTAVFKQGLLSLLSSTYNLPQRRGDAEFFLGTTLVADDAAGIDS